MMIKMLMFDGRMKEIPATAVPVDMCGLNLCVEVIGVNNQSRICFVSAEKCASDTADYTLKNILRAAALQARVAGLPGLVDAVTRDILYFVPMGNTCLRVAARGFDEVERTFVEEG